MGWASTWVKIVNEWFAATIYCKLVSHYQVCMLMKDMPYCFHLDIDEYCDECACSVEADISSVERAGKSDEP